MSRVFAYGSLTVLALVFLGCLGLTFPIEVLYYLVAGWIHYAVRVVPEIKVEWGGVALAVGCFALMAGLSHSFLRWIYATIRWPEEDSRWKSRWTASLLVGVVLMFVAGTAATGIAHQTGWLLTSNEPWISSSMKSLVYRVQSTNNLKMIGLALTNYSTTEGTLPEAASLDTEGRLLHGWQARLLPYLELPQLANQIDFSRPWDDPRNEAVFRTRVNTYLNPAIPVDREVTDEPAPSHYSGNVLVLGGNSARKLNEISDGTSNTFLAGEVPDHFRPWGDPANWRDQALGINRSPDGFGSPFPGGANFLFADGSVRFFKNTVAPQVFRAIATPAGGETISPDSY